MGFFEKLKAGLQKTKEAVYAKFEEFKNPPTEDENL